MSACPVSYRVAQVFSGVTPGQREGELGSQQLLLDGALVAVVGIDGICEHTAHQLLGSIIS